MKRILPLVIRLVNETQLVLSTMELGDYEASLKSIRRAKIICNKLHAKVCGVVKIQETKTRTRTAKKKTR